MSALELVTGRVLNPGAALTALTPNANSTFAVRTTPEGTKVTLENMWGQNATGGVARIRSPRMHDNVQGVRVRVPKNDARLLLPFAIKEPLYNQDVLTVESTGGAAETDTLCYVVSYEKLPGTEANLKSPAEVLPRIQNIMGAEVTLESGATAGEFGPTKFMSQEMNQFKRPHEYAILGYLVNTECAAVAFHGTDIGEVRIGGPGAVEPAWTGEWFLRLSEETGLPCVPCFQAGNTESILVEVMAAVAKTAVSVTVLCAMLS